MYTSINPVVSIREKRSSDALERPDKKPVDSKVKGLVLERISHAKGTLLPAGAAPQIWLAFPSVFASAKQSWGRRRKRKSRMRKTPFLRLPPIGLEPVDPEGGINALLQFILFVPDFAEAFFFAPRKFSCFVEWLDQYHLDQQDNRALCSASGEAIFHLLHSQLCLPLSPFGLYEGISTLFQILELPWRIDCTCEETLQKERPSHLFLSQEAMKRKQIWLEPQLVYDLQAFIEQRPDGRRVQFVTYVKVNGSWYQCDDERITLFRSPSLALPLSRATLLYYQKISFGLQG